MFDQGRTWESVTVVVIIVVIKDFIIVVIAVLLSSQGWAWCLLSSHLSSQMIPFNSLYVGGSSVVVDSNCDVHCCCSTKPTMKATASPRAANPKMVKSPASMTQVSSSFACTEDGYFKHSHTTSFGGDKRSDSGCFFVGFGVGGRLTCY